MLQNFIKTNFQNLYLKEKSLKYYSFFYMEFKFSYSSSYRNILRKKYKTSFVATVLQGFLKLLPNWELLFETAAADQITTTKSFVLIPAKIGVISTTRKQV